MNQKNNQKIRQALQLTGMKYWQLADLLKISEASLSRKLRHELSDQEQEIIVNRIKEATNHAE